MAVNHSVRMSVRILITPLHLAVHTSLLPASQQATRLELHHQLLAAILFGSEQGAQPSLRFGARIHHKAEPPCGADVDNGPSRCLPNGLARE